MLAIVSSALPLLLRVMIWALLVVPVFWLGKVKVEGVRKAVAAGVGSAEEEENCVEHPTANMHKAADRTTSPRKTGSCITDSPVPEMGARCHSGWELRIGTVSP
jgi:hypothetical protein